MTVIPRPFQDQIITESGLALPVYGSVLILSPTGSGKTVIFCEITRRVLAKGKRIVILAHRIEIIEQIGLALFRIGVMHGWVAPGHAFQKQPVMVAMVQSLVKRLDQIEKPDLLIVDEAHHATSGTYRKIMEAWPDIYVLGVSASPARTDGRGLGDCFKHIVMGPSMKELIARGYLAPFRCFAPPVVADLSNVSVRAGDFAAEQLVMLMDRRNVTGDAVKHYKQHLDGRPAIAFCSSVAHSEHVAEQFREAGWNAASVDGAMALPERSRRIRAIGDGGLNVLTSCDVISEGTDIPAVSGAIMLRPTQSLIVHLQQGGRVLRPKPDGSAAIILDHVGNVMRLGMLDAPRTWTLDSAKPKRAVAPPVRQCPNCFACFAPAPKCPACQFVFPVDAKRSIPQAGDGSLSEVSSTDIDARQHYLRETPLSTLVRAAKTPEALREISAARGFKPGWVGYMLKLKAQGRAKTYAWKGKAA